MDVKDHFVNIEIIFYFEALKERCFIYFTVINSILFLISNKQPINVKEIKKPSHINSLNFCSKFSKKIFFANFRSLHFSCAVFYPLQFTFLNIQRGMYYIYLEANALLGPICSKFYIIKSLPQIEPGKALASQ
jgi:hypothetical protein